MCQHEYRQESPSLRRKRAPAERTTGLDTPLFSRLFYLVQDDSIRIMDIRIEVKPRLKEIQALLQQLGPVTYRQTASLKDFKDIVRGVLEKYSVYDLYIPTNYGVGDGIIGIDILQQVEQIFSLHLRYLYTHYTALGSVFPIKSYNETKKGVPTLTFFLYSTNDFLRTQNEIYSCAQRNDDMLIIGMNVLITSKHGLRYFYHYDDELYSVHHYSLSGIISNYTQAFFDVTSVKNNAQKKALSHILINPFGSVKIKTLPVRFVLTLTDSITSQYPQVTITILTGFHKLKHHWFWRLKLKILLLSRRYSGQVHFQNYSTFKTLFAILKQTDLVISTDTSISHIANYFNIRNISIFNRNKIGAITRTNLFSNSPLGFSLYGNNQFPALVVHSDWKKLTRGILGFIDYFFGNNSDTVWTKDLYDSEYIPSQSKELDAYTLEVNKKMDPLYKIKNY